MKKCVLVKFHRNISGRILERLMSSPPQLARQYSPHCPRKGGRPQQFNDEKRAQRARDAKLRYYARKKEQEPRYYAEVMLKVRQRKRALEQDVPRALEQAS